MKKKMVMLISAVFMLLLIANTGVSIAAIQEGINLCIRTIIPSLFPLLVLTKFIAGNLTTREFSFNNILSKLCKIPHGLGSIYILGIVGGYPMGAFAVYEAYQQGKLDTPNASRMLGFCNNAGPAFIFGIIPGLFSVKYIGWYTWAIQILSSLLTAAIIPKEPPFTAKNAETASISLPKALESGVKSMANICGWILIFRVLIAILSTVLHLENHGEILAAISGVLELSNGCIAANCFQSAILRYIFVNFVLAFGGLCVWMQIHSISKQLSMKFFYLGKVIQSVFAVILSVIASTIIF